MELVTAETIRDRIIPLMQAGVLSDHSALEDAGKDYDTELARKQEEQETLNCSSRRQPTLRRLSS